MGTITIEKANSLFWLGRYIERVYTTTSYYMTIFDIMLDKDPEIYHNYCKQLDILDCYCNDAHFMMNYLYGESNPDSIYSNLRRAYDNAIILRDEIKTFTLSYIQMCMNIFEQFEESNAPILMLQSIQDNILAFWGALSEQSESDELSSNIVKLGKFVERVDLYARLDYSKDSIKTAYAKLEHRKRRVKHQTHMDGLDSKSFELLTNYQLIQEMTDISNLFEV